MTHFPPPAMAPGSSTSRAAAAAAESFASNQRERIYRYVAAHSGATREQISDGLEISQTSVTPRVAELLSRGMLRVFDDNGVTRNGRRAERLMISGKAYSEPPPPDTHQLQLPLSALPPGEQLPPASPSAALNDANAKERATVAADQARVARERETFLELDAKHGAALDALNAEERAALVARLPRKLQEALHLSPQSKIVRFELLKLLERDSIRPHVQEHRS